MPKNHSLSLAQLNQAIEKKLAQGGTYAVAPMRVRDIDYPRVFLASSMNLRDFLLMATGHLLTREFIVYGKTRLTIGETWQQAARMAHSLMENCGVGVGDHVAIAMRNYPEWLISYFAVIATGATVVPLNAWWKTEELGFSLKDCGAKIIICDEKRRDRLQPLKDELGLTFILARSDVGERDYLWDEFVKSGSSDEMPTHKIDADGDFCVLYTSGSTGRPKGAMLTHRGAISALLSWAFLSEIYKEQFPEAQFIPDDPKLLMALPLFHVTASHSLTLLSLLIGRTMVMIDRWDPAVALEVIKREKITNFTGVPTMTHELIALAEPGDLDSMADITTGGAKRPAQHVAEQVGKFPKIIPGSGYGLTETNALGSHNAMQDYVKRPDSAGRVIPPVSEFQIWDEAGNALPTGTVGEVVIKSPANFRGYLNLPKETAKALTPDGWFRTGDLGKFDEEGFLYIVDRLKDLIIRGGENISCLEVENALYRFPGIAEVTVFSVPDKRLNEIVGAAIYPTEGVEIDLPALVDFVKGELAHFKVPEKIWLSPQALPRGGTGKIDKRATRDIALQFPPHWSA